ncbi:PP2C family protein-serine/threonine phosphatase [Paracoccus lutimaris]|uniref:Protein phosphatase n=1 Tax=Paracoccus lutimaris TaxID=1490030 RepID=A0A368Z966_9RHOB|nr:protein phosphatase 2C domain-containing protein [Paracoccus lutimaris]RCW89005.1 protein phosphatase [Paracoccus lutimaris]
MSEPITRPPPLHSVAAPPVFRGSGVTHAGQVRERNEDAILTDPAGLLWAVADGMGGYGHGDMASDMVIDRIAVLSDSALAAPGLRMQIEEANRAILAKAAEPGMNAMGATVVAAMIQNGVATIAWVGDCRAYLWRRAGLRLLTRDHTVVQEMVDQGLLRDEAREAHPERHVVTRAVGAEPSVEVDTLTLPLVAGDRLLLCSDGLTVCLHDADIARIVGGAGEPVDLCRALVTEALVNGAPDNVSVVCIFAQGQAA